jgi:hypothetical protein
MRRAGIKSMVGLSGQGGRANRTLTEAREGMLLQPPGHCKRFNARGRTAAAVPRAASAAPA